ncbi:ATP-binding protein [Nodularia sphaerocarpa]|uniref:ATP-binding protein n=1 Tax=Nodularia sphaerocarpa TaxID=137816 RepID=UPI001EFA93FB|nr:ATP-binding protein [Nodularia sphaerocarpa]MDB9376205.1 ATP-binding protein [Nodularia sphaerocarpa CS-585]MDB9376489.1 ATP-binding protein [Nodularia sphaerocarpa CS-585A2]ULP74298.1 Signal transduction histidine-protein kinase AtoS [Nodularia sphaerocarpa UHCC 0038]
MLATRSITNANELNLRLESTLQELPLWKIQIELERPVNELTKLFEQQPLLPGIILTKNNSYQGMMSRTIFFEHMSRPFSFGLFSKRPIQHLYKFLRPEIFILVGNIPIVKATQTALERSPKLVYEPIIVATESGDHGLLDFHQLLLANTEIHTLTQTQLQRVEEQSKVAKAGFDDLQHNYSRLLQNDKMAALGQLVAGVAHEINNPVNFISGNLVYAKDYSQKLLHLISLYQQYYPHPVAEIQTKINQIELEFLTADLPNLLNSMDIGCDRIEQIVRSLKNFSRLDEADKKTVDIHEGMDSTLLILQSRLKKPKTIENITLIKSYGTLPLVECYPGLLNQVFMNILNNAIDALEESIVNGKKNDPPTIEICTQVIGGNWIEIHITDNGTGIPDNFKQRLFDPFFTTKPVGKGTGLGLSISYQIVVEKHGGQLNCVSTQGQGTEFIIKIPVAKD